MKKITSLLIAIVMLLSLWSCGDTVEEDVPKSSQNSSSNKYVLTKDMISDMLLSVKNESISTKGTLSEGKQTLPAFMSLEKVQELVKAKDYSFSEDLLAYEKTVEKEFYALINELPEKCIAKHYPSWIMNALPEVDRYIVLDPVKLADRDVSELGLYLEWEYYNAKNLGGVDKRYDMDKIRELEEYFSDIGTVLVEVGSSWKYLDIETNTLEQIEYFTDHREIKLESLNSLTAQMDEKYSVNTNK